MSKIVGFARADFTTKDGTEITGYSVYIEEPVTGNDCSGVKTDRFFLTDNKVKKMNVDLYALVDKEVNILYNRYGKPEQITVVDDDLITID